MTQTQAPPRTREQALLDYADADARQRTGSSPYQWTKGDILVEQFGLATRTARGGDRHSESAEESSFSRFITESGSDDSYQQARDYHAVSSAFSDNARYLNIPWTTHRVFVNASIGRVPDPVAKLQEFVPWCDAQDIGRSAVRYTSRRAEHFVGWDGTRQIAREDLVPEVTRGLADMQPEDREAVINEVLATDTAVATSGFQTIARAQPEAVEAGIEDPGTAVVVSAAVTRRVERFAREGAERRDRYGAPTRACQ